MRTYFCPECNKMFEQYPSRKQIFCSRSCGLRARYKRKPKRRKMCERCMKPFDVTHKNRRNRFCSHECYSKTREAKPKPNEQQLRHLVSKLSIPHVAEMYGVTVHTVHNWCKKAEIPSKPAHRPKGRFSPGQWALLFWMRSDRRRLRAVDIAALIGRRRAHVTRDLHRLVEAGVVRREVVDWRTIYYQRTKKGEVECKRAEDTTLE